ncbi:MAG: response regulator transcription factor [Thermoleophilia bacterium]|nr:response regulator transcription factor [Thermoleophilia bacterium]
MNTSTPHANGREALARARSGRRQRSRDRCDQADSARHEVTLDGRSVRITPSEFRLLAVLAERRRGGHALRAVRHALEQRRSLDTRACDLHVARLRHKIESDPSRPSRLLTVRGVGYRLVP